MEVKGTGVRDILEVRNGKDDCLDLNEQAHQMAGKVHAHTHIP